MRAETSFEGAAARYMRADRVGEKEHEAVHIG